MTVANWIKSAQSAGWRIAGSSGRVIRLRCAAHGCPGSKDLPLDNLGPAPDPCDLPHDSGYSRATFTEYRLLVEELRRRRRSLGLDQIDLNDAIGAPDGYVSKLESFARTASAPMLALWCEALGLSFAVLPAKLPPATAKAIENRQGRPYQEQQARWKHAQDALPRIGHDK